MTDMTNPTPPTAWPELPEAGMIDRILDIIAHEGHLDRAALVPDATMATLNIASIDMVSILFEVEDKFNIYIPMGDELAQAVYLHDLIKVLADQMQAGATPAPKAE